MKKLSNEVKIGLTIGCALLIAIVGFRFMLDLPVFRQTDILHTRYDRVDGINVGTTILMSGVKVGTVREVNLTDSDSVHVVLNLSYDNGIPVGSVALIQSVDIIGNKAVIIQRSGRMENIEDGGYIEGRFDEGFMGEVRTYGERLGPQVVESTENLSSIIQELDRVMRGGGSQDVELFLHHLSQTTQNADRIVREKEQELTTAIRSLQNILANVDTLSSGRQEQVDSLLTNLEITGRDLNRITDELGDVSSELTIAMKKINNGEGSLGLIINDPSLYHNLDSLSYNMNKLIKEINENPNHFLKHMRLIDLF
ncbi:MAG: MlaD family protein [Balneolales bacterium]